MNKLLNIILLSAIVIMAGCSEEEGSNPDSLDASAESSVNFSSEMNATLTKLDADVQTAVSTSFGGTVPTMGARSSQTICPDYTSDLQNNTITIDYGEDGCSSSVFNYQGAMTVSFSGEYSNNITSEEGFTYTVDFDNFKIDSVTLNGTRSYSLKVNMDTTDQTFSYEYTISSSSDNLNLVWDNGDEANHSGNHTIKYGFSMSFDQNQTPENFDFNYTIEGSSSGTNREGVTYEAEITEPLELSPGCFDEGSYFAVQGKQSVTIDGNNYTVDYGDGTCDNKATVDFGGGSKEIELDASFAASASAN